MNNSLLLRLGAFSLVLSGLCSGALATTVAQQTPAGKTTPTTSITAPLVQAQTLDPSVVLATGSNALAIKSSDVLAELQRAPAETRRAFLSKPDQVRQLVSNLLVRRVLAQEGEQAGLLSDPLVLGALSVAMDRVLSDAWLAQLDAKNEPTDAALEAYAQTRYKAEGNRFDHPAQTRARHILLEKIAPDALEKAKNILQQLKAGESFESLAKTYSTDTGSAARGGDLGYFAAGKMVKPFEDAVNALTKPGDLSEPVETQFGYHIIRLEERRDAGRQAFAEVRDVLRNEARNALLSEARVAKVVEISRHIEFDQKAIEGLSSKN